MATPKHDTARLNAAKRKLILSLLCETTNVSASARAADSCSSAVYSKWRRLFIRSRGEYWRITELEHMRGVTRISAVRQADGWPSIMLVPMQDGASRHRTLELV